MESMPVWFYGFLGLFIGSFLNVCIYRIPRQESLAWPGSHCPGCGRFITPAELIPVISWLLQRGKCRGCGMKISARYPFVELLTGIAFLWAAASANGNELVFASRILFLSGLIVIFFVDIDYWIIPDKVVFPLIGAGLVIAWANGTVVESATAGCVGFTAFLLIAIVGTFLMKKEAMGGGDIKLAGMIGVYLGMSNMLLGLFLAFFIGSLASIPVLIAGRKKTLDPVPFGPMMAAGAAAAMIYGQEILRWYGLWMQNLWI